MKKLTTFVSVALLSTAFGLSGCKKKDEAPKAAPKTTLPAGSAAATAAGAAAVAAGSAAAAALDTTNGAAAATATAAATGMGSGVALLTGTAADCEAWAAAIIKIEACAGTKTMAAPLKLSLDSTKALGEAGYTACQAGATSAAASLKAAGC